MAPSYGRGITNAQASYLAALCREAGVPYSGSGMTSREASTAIDALRREIDARERQAGAGVRRRSQSAQPS